jgi:hypothetical protein
MGVTRLILPALVAIATAACSRQEASYYVVDPATHQPVPVVQQSPPAYAQARYAQADYRQLPAPDGRGLLSTPQVAQHIYAQSRTVQPTTQQPPAQPQEAPNGRGLFNTFSSQQSAPTYLKQADTPLPAPQPNYPQAYATPQAYAPPSYPPQTYARQSPQPQYSAPPSGVGGPYAAAAQSNPFAQARWY